MVGKCNCQNVSVLCMALCWKKTTKLFCFQRLWLFKVNFQSVTEWKGGSLCCQIENFHWHFDWMLWSSHIRSPVAEASIGHHQGGSEESVKQYQLFLAMSRSSHWNAAPFLLFHHCNPALYLCWNASLPKMICRAFFTSSSCLLAWSSINSPS